jgi:hypothetical protein
MNYCAYEGGDLQMGWLYIVFGACLRHLPMTGAPPFFKLGCHSGMLQSLIITPPRQSTPSRSESKASWLLFNEGTLFSLTDIRLMA